MSEISKNTVVEVYENCVKMTKKEERVPVVVCLVCVLSEAASNGLKLGLTEIYINSKVLKHIYDKRTAEEFYTILIHLIHIAGYPDEVLKNTDTKRGDLAFIKNLDSYMYFCSVEQTDNSKLNIVTIFRFSDMRKAYSYIKSYKSLWKWRIGNPHRDIFVAE